MGGVFLLRCREGAVSPRRDLSGRTSGVLLVLLFEEPEMEAWTEATTLACSGGTYLGRIKEFRCVSVCENMPACRRWLHVKTCMPFNQVRDRTVRDI